MSLENIFTMIKADRYTEDGCEELNKAKKEIEDARRFYKPGEISEKTGLQKQSNGTWAPPKETQFGKVQQNKEGQWGVQTKLGKGSEFIKHKDEKEAKRALANYTAGYNRTGRNKEDPHSNEKRYLKHLNKETEQISKKYGAGRRAEHAAHFQNSGAAPETSSGKWQKNEDYLGRERISMKTPQGGKVSIYESDNPKQKNARFRVDTGSHYNEFNTMEEAKAFAEKQYGAESKPAEKKSTAIAEWEESAKTDAKSYNENMVILQNEKGETTAIRESSPDVEKAEAHGYKKMSLVRPDGSVKRHSENSRSKAGVEKVLNKPAGLPAAKHFEAESKPSAGNTKNEREQSSAEKYIAQQKALEQEDLESTPEGRRILHMLDKGDIPDYFKSVTTKKDLDVLIQQAEERMPDPSEFDQPGKRDEYIKLNNLLNKIDRVYNKTRDAAPRVLTGDCRIRIRK